MASCSGSTRRPAPNAGAFRSARRARRTTRRWATGSPTPAATTLASSPSTRRTGRCCGTATPATIRPATAVVAEGIAYIGGTRQRRWAPLRLRCRDGRPPVERDEPLFTPAVLDGVGYSGGVVGTVIAFDTADGTERWQAELGGFVRNVAIAERRDLRPQRTATANAPSTRWTRRRATNSGAFRSTAGSTAALPSTAASPTSTRLRRHLRHRRHRPRPCCRYNVAAFKLAGHGSNHGRLTIRGVADAKRPAPGHWLAAQSQRLSSPPDRS